MKKWFLLTMILLAWAPGIWAQSAPSASGWYLGLGTGVSVPTDGWGPDYYLGQGGILFGGYRFDPGFSLQGDIESLIYTGGGHSTLNPRFLAESKWSLSGQTLKPYALLGLGFDLQFASPSGDSTMNPDALAGLGMDADLGDGKFIFLEARYNLTLTGDGTLSDIPVLAGLWMTL